MTADNAPIRLGASPALVADLVANTHGWDALDSSCRCGAPISGRRDFIAHIAIVACSLTEAIVQTEGTPHD